MENVRGHLNLCTLFDIAGRRVRYKNYEAWLDRTECLSACLSYPSPVHAVLSLGREAGDAELHFWHERTKTKSQHRPLTESDRNAHHCI